MESANIKNAINLGNIHFELVRKSLICSSLTWMKFRAVYPSLWPHFDLQVLRVQVIEKDQDVSHLSKFHYNVGH